MSRWLYRERLDWRKKMDESLRLLSLIAAIMHPLGVVFI